MRHATPSPRPSPAGRRPSSVSAGERVGGKGERRGALGVGAFAGGRLENAGARARRREHRGHLGAGPERLERSLELVEPARSDGRGAVRGEADRTQARRGRCAGDAVGQIGDGRDRDLPGSIGRSSSGSCLPPCRNSVASWHFEEGTTPCQGPNSPCGRSISERRSTQIRLSDCRAWRWVNRRRSRYDVPRKRIHRAGDAFIHRPR